MDLKKLSEDIYSNPNPYIFIMAGNLLPLFAYLVLGWDMKGIFLFYTAEICIYQVTMIPRIIMWAEVYSSRKGKGTLFKIFFSIYAIIIHTFMFLVTVYFMLITAFSKGHSFGDPSWGAIRSFFISNLFLLIIIASDYAWSFYINYARNEEYRMMDMKSNTMEMILFHVTIITSIVIINAMVVFFLGFKESAAVFRFIVLYVIIALKTIAQFYARYRKGAR